MPKLGLTQSNAEDDVIVFGPFRLSPAERLLERAGVRLKLSDRAFDILIVLAEHAGQVVSKKDLIARAWPDTNVDEGNLRFHIASLRKVLADGNSGVRYVTTVPGRGYCLVVPIVRPSALRLLTTKTRGAHANGLPSRLMRMVGRDEIVQSIQVQLEAKRFVSIVGPAVLARQPSRSQ
jgi:DNA-binding winged helix-turn-helix (wHTH) protein